jgi:hypothetical protein
MEFHRLDHFLVRRCDVLLDEKIIYLNDKTLTASFTDRINLREDLTGGGSIQGSPFDP